VAEWSIAPDLKSGVPQGTVGSNPTLSVLTNALPPGTVFEFSHLAFEPIDASTQFIDFGLSGYAHVLHDVANLALELGFEVALILLQLFEQVIHNSGGLVGVELAFADELVTDFFKFFGGDRGRANP
jgi:hypothetical protein